MGKKIQFASIGDCCIDIYPQYKKVFPGGTAFNIAIQASKRGGTHTSIFSAIGTDSYGNLFQESLRTHGVDIASLKTLEGNTSSIKITLETNGKRFFSDWQLGVLGKYALSKHEEIALQKYDLARVVLFRPIKQLFEQFCAMSLPTTIKVADFAGASVYSEGVNIIKQHIKSLDIVVKSLEGYDNASLQFLRQLSAEHKNKIILVLLGDQGSLTFLNRKTYKQPAIKTQVKDTNGAGDAYVANFLTTYLQTQNIPKAMIAGTTAAADKITHLGETV